LVTLWASSDAPDTDFTARLIDAYSDGFAQQLCYGIVRARFRNGLDSPELTPPGEIYEFQIDMLPTCNRFLPGHRIRVDISSSDFPNFDRNHNTGGIGLSRSFGWRTKRSTMTRHDGLD